MSFPLLRNASGLLNKRVLLRMDLNLPMQEGSVIGEARIQRSLATIAHLKKQRASVIVLSHRSEEGASLKPIVEYLNTITPSVFIKNFFDKAVLEKALRNNPGSLIVCENLRLYSGEKANDPAFAAHLSELGDVYVNEAFSVSHREHASIVSLPRLMPSYAGYLFEEEAENLKTVADPRRPFLFILGGGKASSKIGYIEYFLDRADTVFVGGAIANNFFRCEGYEIGRSTFDHVDTDYCHFGKHPKMMLPIDVVVRNKAGVFFRKSDEVEPDDMILDAGSETLAKLEEAIVGARYIAWNGPVGDYLIPGFERGTHDLVKLLAGSDAQKIVGGGDSVAVVAELGAEKDFDYISTAGGAMLEYMAKSTLPGIEALRQDVEK